MKQEVIENTNETRSWFFEKINNIDKPLARLRNKGKTQIPNIRHERGDITTNPMEAERIEKEGANIPNI